MSMKNFIIFLLINFIVGEDKYYVKIKNVDYEFEFKDTEVANQIKAKLPFTVPMTNLNGNEVYYQFSGESFTAKAKSVQTINMGDIYLYQSNFLVLFYKTFTTSYSYTEIGKLKDPTGLDTLIGNNNVEVQWLKNSEKPNGDTTKEETTDTSEETVKNTPEDTTKKTSEETNKDITEDTTKETSDDTSKPTSTETNEHSPDFDVYGYQKYMKMNYFIWLLLTLILN